MTRPLRNFDELPDSAYVDQREVERNYGKSKSQVDTQVREGTFPRPVMDGRKRKWRVGDLRAHYANLEKRGAPHPTIEKDGDAERTTKRLWRQINADPALHAAFIRRAAQEVAQAVRAQEKAGA